MEAKPNGATWLPSCGDRAFDALLLYKQGHSLTEIAAALPNRSHGDTSVSAKSAEIILRQGARVLLSSIMRNSRPGNLPDDLWPSSGVRDVILQQNTWRTRLRALRHWLEDGSADLKANSLPRADITNPQ
jgi:hypothetical protein